MKLYHTSINEIRDPDIYRGRKNADFGQGFYLTPDREFTYRWATGEAVVNEYEFNESGLTIHSFERDEDWFQYIFNNRRGKDTIPADAVIGPIANDTIFDTLGIITSGYLKPAEAMSLLMIGPEYTQIAIKTERAAAQLKWTGSERIVRYDESVRKAEQDEYQTVFAEVLQNIVSEE